MKNFIENSIKFYPSLFKHPIDVLVHLFAAGGNGLSLDNKGYLESNYRGDEAYNFPAPIPIKQIYTWSDHIPVFSKYAGCRDVGFKESALYFIDCLKISSDDDASIKEWKDNIEIVERVLLETPTIGDEYPDIEAGYEVFKSKIQNAKVTDERGGKCKISPKSVQKVWFFDVQWSDCPDFVEDEVKHIWRNHELGNDNYIYKCTLDEELFENYPNVYYWLKHSGVPEGEKVMVHWWW